MQLARERHHSFYNTSEEKKLGQLISVNIPTFEVAIAAAAVAATYTDYQVFRVWSLLIISV
jgi:hypothetical protein